VRGGALTELEARDAGYACGLADTGDVVDTAVVVGALTRGDAVVTSDPLDLARIADALSRKLAVHVI
jgi:hypothetical protein